MDIRVTNHGSLVGFWPVSEAAIEHCDEHFPEDCPMLGAVYLVEPRFAGDIIEDLLAQGFTIN